MTANDMLPSNLTFDEILTVLLCGSGSGQFRFSEHNFKKRCETIRTASQQVRHSRSVCAIGFVKCTMIFIVLGAGLPVC